MNCWCNGFSGLGWVGSRIAILILKSLIQGAERDPHLLENLKQGSLTASQDSGGFVLGATLLPALLSF